MRRRRTDVEFEFRIVVVGRVASERAVPFVYCTQSATRRSATY